jgi:hypothetical protein
MDKQATMEGGWRERVCEQGESVQCTKYHHLHDGAGVLSLPTQSRLTALLNSEDTEVRWDEMR